MSPDGKTLTIKQVSTGLNVISVNLSDATSGLYTVTQLNPIDHPTAGVSEEEVFFTINYKVTSSDGDIANGTLSINVDDDTPTTTSNLTVQLDDDALAAAMPAAPATMPTR